MLKVDELKQNILKAATHLATKIRSTEGQADAFKQLVPIYLQRNEVDFAASLADTLNDPFTRDQLLMEIAERCASINDDDYALQLADAIEDDSINLQALERIAVRKISLGQVDKALQIADSIEHPDNIYSELVVYLTQQGALSDAKEITQRIYLPTIKAATQLQMAIILLEQSQMEDASSLIDEALQTSSEIDYKIDEIKTLIEIGNTLIRAEMLDKAIKTLDRARQETIKLNDVAKETLLSVISTSFLESGNIELADETLDLISDKTIIASTLSSFANIFWKKNQQDEAIDSLTEAFQILKSQTNSEIRSSSLRLQVFRIIATQFATIGDFEKAIMIAESIEDYDELQLTLTHIAKAFAAQGKDDLADEVIKMINEDDVRMFALIELADVKISLGQNDSASNYLQKAAELTDSVFQPFSRSEACLSIAERFIGLNQQESASRLFQESIENAAEIRDETLRVISLIRSAQLCEKYNLTLSENSQNKLREIIVKSETQS